VRSSASTGRISERERERERERARARERECLRGREREERERERDRDRERKSTRKISGLYSTAGDLKSDERDVCGRAGTTSTQEHVGSVLREGMT
jgi:hypothetical protein